VRLRQRGHHVTVLTSNYGVKDRPMNEADVLRTLHLEADIYHYRPLDFFFKRPGQMRQNARELRRVIDQVKPDLVVVFGMWNLTHKVPHWAEVWLTSRVAYYISATWPSDPDTHIEYWNLPANRVWSSALKRPARALALYQLKRERYPPPLRFEHAMCVSHYVRNTLIGTGHLSERAHVIYNGIDPEPWLKHARSFDAPLDDPLRLVYMGTLSAIKGVHLAIEALGTLKQRGLGQRLDLSLIGSGHPDYEARLRGLVDQFELHDRVHFTGQIARDAMPMRLPAYDVFLFTSYGPEAMARTVMEAMAAGLMVIGAETGGQVEMFEPQQNALTFKAEDVTGLANQIERALNDSALRVRLARAGQQTVLNRFTLDRMVDNIESWLEGIVRETHTP
jgi:glycosyltransferase involved in cell wall biosynthesis